MIASLRTLLLLSVLTLASASAHAQTVVYVDASAPPGGDGTSWATATNDLLDGQILASPHASLDTPAQVWVRAGTYYPTNQSDIGEPRSRSVFIGAGVDLLGGFNGTETSASEREPFTNITTISGDLGVQGDPSDNAWQVIRVVGSSPEPATLDGFVIRGGRSTEITDRGAGLRAEKPFILRRCRFTDNIAATWGGAIHQSGGDSGVVIEDCVFDNNSCLNGTGGAIDLDGSSEIRRCRFESNDTPNGAAVDSNTEEMIVEDCVFLNNGQGAYLRGATVVRRCHFENSTGGGFIAGRGASETDASLVEDCTFLNNSSPGRAGAIQVRDHDHKVDIIGCRFIGNSAVTDGGAIYLNTEGNRVENCLFVMNSANRGGAIWISTATGVRLITSCTIVANTANSAGGGIYNDSIVSRISNSILWGNQVPGATVADAQIKDFTGTLLVDHSGVEGLPDGAFFGTQNSTSDPLFVDPDGPDDIPGTLDDDYSLSASSPYIDYGENQLSQSSLDVAGAQRIVGARVDSGAYEFQGVSETYPGLCFGDGARRMSACIACPCENDLLGTRGGCSNSAGTSAILSAIGVASVTQDSLHLELAGARPATFANLFSGAGLAPTNPAHPCFGQDSGILSLQFDGLRCAVQGVRRHGLRPTDVNGDVGESGPGWGGIDPPAGGIALSSSFTAGQVRYFQTVYRESISAGCGTGLNTSQAVRVQFLP